MPLTCISLTTKLDRELVGATEVVATDPFLKKHQMLNPLDAMERERELRSNT